MYKIDYTTIIELLFNTKMADSYNILESSIRTMLQEEVATQVETTIDQRIHEIEKKYNQLYGELYSELEDRKYDHETYIERCDKLADLYDIEIDILYSSIGKEFDSAFTGSDEGELINYIVDARMELFETQIGKITLCNQYIRTNLNLENGDVVQIGGQGYRNEHLMFWSHARGLVYPDYKSGSDYGTVPSLFIVGNGPDEFSHLHWVEVIDYYDGFIWLSDTLQSEIKTTFVKSGDSYTTNIMIHGQPVLITSETPAPTKFQLFLDNKNKLHAYE